MMGCGAPDRISNFDWATLGKFSGHVSRGTSRIGVPNCSRRCSSQASMAGQRFFVRGDTYRPWSSKPPWQRTPPRYSGSAMAWSASSSSGVNSV